MDVSSVSRVVASDNRCLRFESGNRQNLYTTWVFCLAIEKTKTNEESGYCQFLKKQNIVWIYLKQLLNPVYKLCTSWRWLWQAQSEDSDTSNNTSACLPTNLPTYPMHWIMRTHFLWNAIFFNKTQDIALKWSQSLFLSLSLERYLNEKAKALAATMSFLLNFVACYLDCSWGHLAFGSVRHFYSLLAKKCSKCFCRNYSWVNN